MGIGCITLTSDASYSGLYLNAVMRNLTRQKPFIQIANGKALWNDWASSHGSKGLQDVDDLDDFTEVDEWIESVLTNFCSTIGNPVKQVNRLMGGA